jgi:hypothetical protein
LAIQQQAGLVGRFEEAQGNRNRGRDRCLQSSQAQVARKGPAAAGTTEAALLDGLVEEDVHEWLLLP